MAVWSDNLSASDGSLLAAYDFEETTGPVVDSGPASNDGTNNGATRGATGKIGNAFDFLDSSSSYVSSTITAPGTGDYTFSLWVNFDSKGSFDTLFELGNYSDGNGVLLQYGSSSDRLALFENGGSSVFDIGALGFTTGSYHHVLVRRSGSTLTLFFDSVNKGGGSSSDNITRTDLVIGKATFDSGNNVDGKIDLFYTWNSALSDTQVSDLYNANAGLEYAEIPRTTYSHASPFLDGSTATTYAHTSPFIDGVSATTYAHTSIIIKGEKEKTTYAHTSPFLAGKVATAYAHADIQLRGEGVQSYYFDLRDDTDTLEDSATGAPPTLIFPDLFTGVSDGLKTLYIRSVQKYKNLEDTINETMIRFRLVAGIIQPLLPNLPLSVTAETQAGAMVDVSWNYNPTNEETPPTTFEVYADAVSVDTVAYTGATSYKVTLGPFPEVSTVFSVSSLNGVNETVKVVSPAVTPDGTPPETVPFTFEVK